MSCNKQSYKHKLWHLNAAHGLVSGNCAGFPWLHHYNNSHLCNCFILSCTNGSINKNALFNLRCARKEFATNHSFPGGRYQFLIVLFMYVLFIPTGSPSVHIVHGALHGAVLLLHGGVRLVGLSGARLVPGGRPEMGTRSDRKQIASVPSVRVGSARTADHLRAGAGQSRR